ncbi:MAG: hypothetical protein R3F55_24465 [Alphaproteobacteria bacterium]
MRRASAALVLATLATAGALPPAQAADLAHLRAMAGQYTDVVMADAALESELRGLLGDGYASFAEDMQVVFPSELVDGHVLVATGCRAHDCGAHGGMILVDVDTGTVQVLQMARGISGIALTPGVQGALATWMQ